MATIPARMRMKESDADVLARQNKTLDVETLCGKLEAYKREQDVVRVRKEKRDDLRNGRYVPRAAARELHATTTPTRENPSRRGHRSAPLAPIAEPNTHEATSEPRPLFAAMNYLVKGQDGMTTMVAETTVSRNREPTKRDSMSPVAEGRALKRRTAESELSSEGRRAIASMPSTSIRSSAQLDGRPRVPKRSSSRQEMKPSEPRQHIEMEGLRADYAEAKESDASLYRPGDAARRRSTLDRLPKDSAVATPSESARRSSIHALQDMHLHASSTLPVLEESDNDPMDSSHQRPKYAPNDRPDWCQRSQNGESPQGLHFFSRVGRKTDDAGGRGKSGGLLPESNNMFGEAEKAQSGHLIADAVKIIKDQEKLQRRKSVIGFFKKL